MKRYEIEHTTTINNIKNLYNEFVKSMDLLGYTNLLKNNYFKNKLKNAQYGDPSENNVILSKWINPDPSEPTYDGCIIDGDDYKYLTADNYTDIFGINSGKELSQEISFNDLERLSNNGTLNLSLFFIKENDDAHDLTIRLQKSLDDGVNWADITDILDTNTSTIAGEFTDSTGYFYSINDKFIFRQYSVIYNLYNDYYYRYAETTNEILFRVVIKNESTSPDIYKYLQNALCYFGRTDASSFVKNVGEENNIFQYDDVAGDYYYTTDGIDKVYLSSGKYILTVGTYGQYPTIQDAIDSIANDNSSFGSDRIIFLTSDLTLTENTIFIDTIGTGNFGITLMANGHSLTIDNDAFLFNIKGTDGTHLVKNITIENLRFVIGSGITSTTIPIKIQYAENITFKNVYVDGDFKVSRIIDIDNLYDSNIHFTQFKNYGYGVTASKSGYGIYMDNSEVNNIKVQHMILVGDGSYTYPDTLIGIYTYTNCVNNEISIQYFEETA